VSWLIGIRPRTVHDSAEPALHARAPDHGLQKRISNGRMTWYDIEVPSMFLLLFLYFSKSDRLCRVACGGYYQPSDFVSDRCDTHFGHIYGSLDAGRRIECACQYHCFTSGFCWGFDYLPLRSNSVMCIPVQIVGNTSPSRPLARLPLPKWLIR
jgi:hypothetical protein